MNIDIRRIGYDDIINHYFSQFRAFNDAHSREIYPDEQPDSDERLREIISEKDSEFYRFTAFDQDKIVGSFSSGKLKPNHPEYENRKHRVVEVVVTSKNFCDCRQVTLYIIEHRSFQEFAIAFASLMFETIDNQQN